MQYQKWKLSSIIIIHVTYQISACQNLMILMVSFGSKKGVTKFFGRDQNQFSMYEALYNPNFVTSAYCDIFHTYKHFEVPWSTFQN